MVLIGRPGYRVAAEVDLNQVFSGLQRRGIASGYEGGFSVHRVDDDRELLARGAPHSALDQRIGLVVRPPGGAARYQRHGQQANDCLRTRHDMPPEPGNATRELYAPRRVTVLVQCTTTLHYLHIAIASLLWAYFALFWK